MELSPITSSYFLLFRASIVVLLLAGHRQSCLWLALYSTLKFFGVSDYTGQACSIATEFGKPSDGKRSPVSSFQAFGLAPKSSSFAPPVLHFRPLFAGAVSKDFARPLDLAQFGSALFGSIGILSPPE